MLSFPRIGLLGTILLLALSVPRSPHADLLVLVHGYLGSGKDWRESGITRALAQAGWIDAGHLGRQRAHLVSGDVAGDARLYTVDLPSEAPLPQQSRVLAARLQWLQTRHAGERMLIAGHSAGGVVARLTMVQHPELNVDTLVTIAAPHLGTDRAELGLLAGQTPLAMLAPFVGGQTLNRSQKLYSDLVREQPGSLLHWLNRQPHPQANYICLVRHDDITGFMGDQVVPPWSQDLNNVQALRGRARTITVPEGHGLSIADGRWLARLLAAARID